MSRGGVNLNALQWRSSEKPTRDASLRGGQRRSNPRCFILRVLDCFVTRLMPHSSQWRKTW